MDVVHGDVLTTPVSPGVLFGWANRSRNIFDYREHDHGKKRVQTDNGSSLNACRICKAEQLPSAGPSRHSKGAAQQPRSGGSKPKRQKVLGRIRPTSKSVRRLYTLRQVRGILAGATFLGLDMNDAKSARSHQRDNRVRKRPPPFRGAILRVGRSLIYEVDFEGPSDAQPARREPVKKPA